MKTLEDIYQNNLGNSYKVCNEKTNNCISLEINKVSFLVSSLELKAFVNSTESILNHYQACTCPLDLENKMVVYQAAQTEIRMKLSYNQLLQLNDLLKGTDFKLSMDDILTQYKIS